MLERDKSREEKILEVCRHVFKAMKLTRVPMKDMPELAEALYLLRAVVKQIDIENKKVEEIIKTT